MTNYDSNYSILYDIAQKLGIENISNECTYSRAYDIYASEEDVPQEVFDSIYSVAFEIYKNEGGSAESKFDSIFSICYAIYQLLGGEDLKDSFDSTYSILLTILDIIQDTGVYIYYSTSNNQPIVNDFTQSAKKSGTKNGMFYLKFDELNEIPNNAFNEQITLTSIVLPDTITSIGSYAFKSTNITEIIIPENVTSIGRESFMLTKISEILIPDSVKSILQGAFVNTYNVDTIIIGSEVETIGDLGLGIQINSTTYVRFKCATPPIGTGGNNDWKNSLIGSNNIIYVPQESVSLYENTFLDYDETSLNHLEFRAYRG